MLITCIFLTGFGKCLRYCLEEILLDFVGNQVKLSENLSINGKSFPMISI